MTLSPGMPESQDADQLFFGIDRVIQVVAGAPEECAPQTLNAGVANPLAGARQGHDQTEGLLEVFFERAGCFGPTGQPPLGCFTDL